MSSNLKALIFLLPLCGCGFAPMYGGGAGESVSQKLDLVDVSNIPERTGQMLRLSLETQLHAAGAPAAERYALNVNYSIGINGIGVQQDTATTRNRFTATANWTLTPIGDPGAKLTSGTAATEDAANIIDQQYFALTLETDTVNQQMADQIAAQITAEVAAYFKSHPDA